MLLVPDSNEFVPTVKPPILTIPSLDRPSASNKILFESDGSAVLFCKTVILLAVIPS